MATSVPLSRVIASLLLVGLAAHPYYAASQQLPSGSEKASAQVRDASHEAAGAPPREDSAYVLGPEDSVRVGVLDCDEIGRDPIPIDLRGNLNLPLAGRVHAAGLTAEALEVEIARRLRDLLRNPVVTVIVAEYRSQPVSVLGAVTTPGVLQIRGRKTLFQIISEAGGLRPDAGNTIKITRPAQDGPIPLPGATLDASSSYYVAEVGIRAVMNASNPALNIAVQPNDVITVPKADLVYVVGAVNKAGGFVLSERQDMSVLQAISMSEGLMRTACASKAKILRQTAGTQSRDEILVNVQKILQGKDPDVALFTNDILFIPASGVKTATYRGLEALIQTTSGMAVYGRY